MADAKHAGSSAAEFVCPRDAYAWCRPDIKTLIKVGPYRLQGAVVEGFKRGSKLLGFPTANLDPAAFSHVFSQDNNEVVGVYAGWVAIDDSEPYKTVLSVGYNPYFKNKDKTVETYILHRFEKDFYGAQMKLIICGYLRPQFDFSSMDALIQAIEDDVKVGSAGLDSDEFVVYKTDPFFVSSASVPAAADATNLSSSSCGSPAASSL